MQSKQKEILKGEKIFVGIDMHKRSWHITIRTNSIELFNGSIPGRWEALRKLLHRYKTQNIYAVYEAGYFGFWLHDHLIQYGVNCLLTPPSLVPKEYGNRVKTDRRDSSKLAHLLAKGQILLELQDVSRFRRAEQLAAYVGLTPSQYSSADKIRMGRITGIGKNSVRATLVESAWKLICKDTSMRIKYEQIKARSGAKRAIVAISRKLLLCTRRLLLDNQPYVYKPVC